ncbi:hypothetical protein WJX75_009125 [Coccomyxa subellipsoidea]|uniref:KAP NTPase domain-containing protein n=1 Tax=Coccomyxa subellipsoidea TaxID=248742 RepID=A0ABR2Z539_9CHLO
MRVIIFIDDLDRCSDATVVSTLEAINLVLGGGKYFVVVGMDKDIVEASIKKEQGYEESSKAAQYLNKIVQMSVQLPECTEEGLGSFLKDMGFNFEVKIEAGPDNTNGDGHQSSSVGTLSTYKDIRKPPSHVQTPAVPGTVISESPGNPGIPPPNGDGGQNSVAPVIGKLMQLSSDEERAIKDGLLCAPPMLPRSLKRFVNMHRLAKGVMYGVIGKDEERLEKVENRKIDLVYAMIVLWHCPMQLKWWIQDVKSGAKGKTNTDFHGYVQNSADREVEPEKKQLMRKALGLLTRLSNISQGFKVTLESLKDFQEGLEFCGLECLP